MAKKYVSWVCGTFLPFLILYPVQKLPRDQDVTNAKPVVLLRQVRKYVATVLILGKDSLPQWPLGQSCCLTDRGGHENPKESVLGGAAAEGARPSDDHHSAAAVALSLALERLLRIGRF